MDGESVGYFLRPLSFDMQSVYKGRLHVAIFMNV